MPEGNRRITLTPPGARQPGRYGDSMPATGEPVVAWAVRVDRRGLQREIADTASGEWRVQFEVRRDGLEGLHEGWTLADETGILYDIESVSESAMGNRRAWIIRAVRREARGTRRAA